MVHIIDRQPFTFGCIAWPAADRWASPPELTAAASGCKYTQGVADLMRTTLMIALFTILGCASNQMTQHIEEVDELLTLGKSTKSDVIEIYGKPNGTHGEAFFPPTLRQQEVWYWQEQPKTSNVRVDYSKNVAYADVQMRVLFIFFRDDLYDGFLYWGRDYKEGMEQ